MEDIRHLPGKPHCLGRSKCPFALVTMVTPARPLTSRVFAQLFYDPDEFGLTKVAFLYFSDFWNKLDIGAILLFIAGLTCR